MRVLAILPARYASTRLPGKPLLDLCGKPMIQRVYEAVQKASCVTDIVVATDDERIVQAVNAFGGRACMTSSDCASGTDRLVEIARTEQADIYLNVQGDEPLLDPAVIETLVQTLLDHPDVAAVTPCYAISAAAATDPNLVKVVRSEEGQALYFSRALIPHDRDGQGAVQYLGHMGLYAYRKEALDVFAKFPPSSLEQVEKLEQLRLLQHGLILLTVEVPPCAPGVDTPADLERVRGILVGQTAQPAEAKSFRISHKHEAFAETASAASISEGALLPQDRITLSLLQNEALVRKLQAIRLVITDVDGVLTDGGLYYGPDGESLKRFCAQDGLGIVLLQRAGIRLAVCSGRDCLALRARLKDLHVSLFRLGRLEKQAACLELLKEAQVRAEEALFIGDDLPDLEGFALCGLGVATGNARPQVRKAADVVLQTSGGQGVLRELIDLLLAVRQG